ncbi:MAG: hypothetical protein M3356_02920 [Actinomycetota bacterium]|nr:hypothetical protein [Actinomycetota bacterium]
MKRLLPAIAALAALAVALPVIAQADHKPGHANPGQPAPPQGGSDLTIAAQPNPTVFRRATVISGSLKGPNNAGKTVSLRQDAFPFGSFDKIVATTTTDAKGDYTFTRRPARNTTYQAVANTGVIYNPGEVSPEVLVKVRIRMSLRVSDRTPRVGQLVRFRGRACPAHDGLTVRIQRKTPRGFRTVRRTKLRAAARCSVYTRRLRIFRDGRYRVTSDDRDHARGFSRSRFLNTPR